jgi:uncharacterized protein involved in exopolysaccharide biosynthesis
MDARGIVSTVFRQARRFLLVFVPVMALAVLYLVSAKPAYESAASLLFKFGQDARPEMMIEGGMASGLSAEEKRGLVVSNLNIITSRDLAEALIRDIKVERAYPEIAVAASSPEAALADAVKAFGSDFSAETKSDAGVIHISLRNTDPVIVTEMLRHLLDLFIQKQAAIFGNPQMDVLKEQMEEAGRRLDDANGRLSAFRAQNGITLLDDELAILLKQRGDLTGYLARRQDPTTAEMQGNGSVEALPARINAAGDSSRFPVLEDIQRRIDTLRAKEAELLQTYRSDSDMVRNIRRNIAAEESALRETLGALNGQIADLDRQIAEKQQHRAGYDELIRLVQVSDSAYKVAQERYQSAQVNDDLNQRKITRVSVIQQPTVPEKPSHPKKLLTLVMALIVGGGLAAARCLFAELMDQTFMNSEQLRLVAGRPVLASFARRRGKAGLFSRKDIAALYQSVALPPGQPSRVVQLVSCHAGEGTSSIAAELARYASDSLKRRVLVVEPSVAPTVQPIVNLLDVVEGHGQLQAALRQAGTHYQTALAVEPAVDRAFANVDALSGVFSQLRGMFDLILVAASGASHETSVLALSRLADGVVVVVEAEKTRAPVVKQILQQLAETGAQIFGTVLNKRNFYIPGWLYNRL